MKEGALEFNKITTLVTFTFIYFFSLMKQGNFFTLISLKSISIISFFLISAPLIKRPLE